MPAKQNKILVIKLGALGDFIQALGPMAAIRKYHPKAHITLLTTAPFENFAKGCGYFDDIWIDEKPGWLNPLGWLNLINRLNEAGFDRVYDLQNNDRTALYFRLFRPAQKPEWVGTTKGASHRNTSPDRTAGHAFDGHVQTLALGGIKNIQIDPLNWIRAGTDSFALRKPYILLVPGCAPQHPQKRWPAKHYAELAGILSNMGYHPVIIGSAAEENIAANIKAQCPDALDLTSQTSLEEIVALARHAAAAVGNDTGPMHMIAPTGCPCLVLFSGYSNPVRHAPKGENVQVLQRENLAALDVQSVMNAFKPREESQKARKTVH